MFKQVSANQISKQLIDELKLHHQTEGAVTPLGAIGVFHCRKYQTLRHVPVHHPSLILILSGTKRLIIKSKEYFCDAGEMLLLLQRRET